MKFDDSLNTVKVPDEFKEQFLNAQNQVVNHFESLNWDPTTGRIIIGGERYVLVRSSSMRMGITETLADILDLDGVMNNPYSIKLTYRFGKSLGKQDARKFHISMGLDNPIEKLSTGPIHFAFTGWAKVNIKEESNPTPDENFYLEYTHPKSFEADTYAVSKGRDSKIPVCVLNAGYSAGWCSESFGIDLDAREITCKAKGDNECLFIMAPADLIEKKVKDYFERQAQK